MLSKSMPDRSEPQVGIGFLPNSRRPLSRRSSIHSGSFLSAEMLRTTSSDRPRWARRAGGVGVGPAELVTAEAVELGVGGLGDGSHCAVSSGVVGLRRGRTVSGRTWCRPRRRGRSWPGAGHGCRAAGRRPRSRPRTAAGTARPRGRPGSGAGTAAPPEQPPPGGSRRRSRRPRAPRRGLRPGVRRAPRRPGRGSGSRARRPAGGRTRRPPRGRPAPRGSAGRWRRGRRRPGRTRRGRRR